jgi:hypothetical protein
MRSMQGHVEFGYQLSIRSGTKENLDRAGRSDVLMKLPLFMSLSGGYGRGCAVVVRAVVRFTSKA